MARQTLIEDRFTLEPSVTPVPFFITFQLGDLHRRQGPNTHYMTSTGRTTSDCLSANSYYIDIQGQLFDNTGLIYSTMELIDSATFTLRPVNGGYSTTWHISGNKSLTFDNATFTGGSASFCQQAGASKDGLVEVYYQSIPPATCTVLHLIALPCKMVQQLYRPHRGALADDD